MSLSDLGRQIERFAAELKREGGSPHTIAAYRSDLDDFRACVAVGPSEVTLPLIRRWLAGLHDDQLAPSTIRRKIAAVRSLFRFMVREGVLRLNIAKHLRSPKVQNALPPVMSQRDAHQFIQGVSDKTSRTAPSRDRAILELLYGCGLRVSELAGLNLEDIDRAERWLLIRGKGRKERQVPMPAKAAAALESYLSERPCIGTDPVILNHRGGRLTTRGIRGIVKFYAAYVSGDPSVHPHSFRHAYASHLLADGADLRAIQELLGHARLSTTQLYTQVNLADLIGIYDQAHPKA